MDIAVVVSRPEDTGKPRYVCPKCGMVEYCRRANGAPRFPEATLKAMQKKHRLVCDGTPEYRAGVAIRKPITGQGA